MGWGMVPTYVGPQAPCWGYQGAVINPGKAAAEGRAAGANSVADAKLFGLAPGSPVYYDMEAYDGDQSCTNAVLIWIALWDGKATLDDGTLDWPIGDREKQYAGNLHGTVGGITLSIDRDVVAGPMAR